MAVSTAHAAREVGGGGVGDRVELFCGERASPQLSGDVSRLPSQYLLSSSVSSRHDHSAYSQLFGSIPHAFRSRLSASLNRRAGGSTFLTPVPNCPYRTSLGMRL